MGVEGARGSFGVDWVEEHRTGDRDRSEGDEHGDGDRGVGSIKSCLGSPMTSFNKAASSVPAQGDADLGCP